MLNQVFHVLYHLHPDCGVTCPIDTSLAIIVSLHDFQHSMLDFSMANGVRTLLDAETKVLCGFQDTTQWVKAAIIPVKHVLNYLEGAI